MPCVRLGARGTIPFPEAGKRFLPPPTREVQDHAFQQAHEDPDGHHARSGDGSRPRRILRSGRCGQDDQDRLPRLPGGRGLRRLARIQGLRRIPHQRRSHGRDLLRRPVLRQLPGVHRPDHVGRPGGDDLHHRRIRQHLSPGAGPRSSLHVPRRPGGGVRVRRPVRRPVARRGAGVGGTDAADDGVQHWRMAELRHRQHPDQDAGGREGAEDPAPSPPTSRSRW